MITAALSTILAILLVTFGARVWLTGRKAVHRYRLRRQRTLWRRRLEKVPADQSPPPLPRAFDGRRVIYLPAA